MNNTGMNNAFVNNARKVTPPEFPIVSRNVWIVDECSYLLGMSQNIIDDFKTMEPTHMVE